MSEIGQTADRAPVDGAAAANTMIAFGTWRVGYCLECVWEAYERNGASTGLSAGTATEAWYESLGQHPGDRNPPAGVPVWWGPKSSSSAGDVVISLGGGNVVATDWPYGGQIGICTIDERERQIGRPYLGWTEYIFDQPIAQGEDDDDMNAEQDNRLRNIENLLAIPGAGYGRPEVIQQNTDKIIGKLETGAGYDWLPAISNQLWVLWRPIAAAAVFSLIAAVAVVFGVRRV